MRRLVTRVVLASLVLTPAAIDSTRGLAAPAAGSIQWERIDDPGVAATSRYEAVESAPDGSIYVAGWHRVPFTGLGDVYESIVRKFDAAGIPLWTAQVGGYWPTAASLPDLVVDGIGNPYLKLCHSTCAL